MSNITRSEAIKQLRRLKADIKFGIASKVENKNQIEALEYAIASLETDEAYQLEYESTTRNCFECKYSKDNHNSGTEECHLCMWENQYTPTTKNDLEVDFKLKDYVSREAVRRIIKSPRTQEQMLNALNSLRNVTECKAESEPQESESDA